MSNIKKFLYGTLIGVVNILLGAGGGMLTVPFYKKIGLSQKQAQMNAVATMLPISIISAYIYIQNGTFNITCGNDAVQAFATAKIALFDDTQGAMIELGNEKTDKAALAQRYAEENSDPINAAKDGYIDAIIEPQFVKQYLIASLQMLLR